MTNPKQTCETCKYYSVYDGDDYNNGVYAAVIRTSCELHVHPVQQFDVDCCEDWEGDNEQ